MCPDTLGCHHDERYVVVHSGVQHAAQPTAHNGRRTPGPRRTARSRHRIRARARHGKQRGGSRRVHLFTKRPGLGRPSQSAPKRPRLGSKRPRLGSKRQSYGLRPVRCRQSAEALARGHLPSASARRHTRGRAARAWRAAGQPRARLCSSERRQGERSATAQAAWRRGGTRPTRGGGWRTRSA